MSTTMKLRSVRFDESVLKLADNSDIDISEVCRAALSDKLGAEITAKDYQILEWVVRQRVHKQAPLPIVKLHGKLLNKLTKLGVVRLK